MFSPFLVFLLQEEEEEEEDNKYSISGVTEGSTVTETDSVDSEDRSSPSAARDPQSAPCSPVLSPADQALARLSRSTSYEPFVKRESPPMDSCDIR